LGRPAPPPPIGTAPGGNLEPTGGAAAAWFIGDDGICSVPVGDAEPGARAGGNDETGELAAMALS
jgi:hypothetical protein